MLSNMDRKMSAPAFPMTQLDQDAINNDQHLARSPEVENIPERVTETRQQKFEFDRYVLGFLCDLGILIWEWEILGTGIVGEEEFTFSHFCGMGIWDFLIMVYKIYEYILIYYIYKEQFIMLTDISKC